MKSISNITDYIEKHEIWREELFLIRSIFLTTELVEEIKWGAPAYTYNKKIVAGFMGFKNHIGIWFHQGVFLSDPAKILVNAQEGKTKALPQWRVEKGNTINTTLLLSYIKEATENCKAGKQMKAIRPSSKKATINKLPEKLVTALNESLELQNAFNAFTPGKQKEYIEYISSAKREATQLNRINKITPLLLRGEGLNDRYKK